MSYTQAIVLYMGFKNTDKYRCGFEDGYFKHVAPFGNAETLTYAPRTWKSNVKALADQLRRQGVRRVAMIGYSHGWAAARAFCDYAYKIGLDVDLLVGCDLVPRNPLLPRWTIAQALSFRSLKKGRKMKLPKNIKRAVYVRQEKDWPAGGVLVATHPSQYVECKGILHTLGHTEIDESDEFWDVVKAELDVWTNPPKATPV